MKGTVRHETIKYASYKKENIKNEIKYTKYIEQLESKLSNAGDSKLHDRIESNLDSKRNELYTNLENRLNDYITRSKVFKSRANRIRLIFFDNLLPKLNENEQNCFEGHIADLECKTTLKEMKNQNKSRLRWYNYRVL